MSLKSMTGFGSGNAEENGIGAEVEVGSVNRKQLDIRISIPRNLAALEPKIKKLIQSKIARGNINALIKVTLSGSPDANQIMIDREMSAIYLRELRNVAEELGLQDDFKASTLLRLPDIIRYKTAADDTEKVWNVTGKALTRALSELIKMRKAEGDILAADIKKRFDRLSVIHKRLIKIAPQVAKQYGKQLRQRLDDAGINDNNLDEIIARELIVFIDKADISEELVRLESHLKQVAGLLKANKPVGRTLDFLCQEMFREINTIGSKGNNTRISKEVIAFKAELETIREQVQNIE